MLQLELELDPRNGAGVNVASWVWGVGMETGFLLLNNVDKTHTACSKQKEQIKCNS